VPRTVARRIGASCGDLHGPVTRPAAIGYSGGLKQKMPVCVVPQIILHCSRACCERVFRERPGGGAGRGALECQGEKDEDGLLWEVPSPKLLLVHKNRLGARPPRKRSAPVAGKRIRNDETPPKARFRVFGVRGRSLTEGAWGSFRAVRGLTAQFDPKTDCRSGASSTRSSHPSREATSADAIRS
jgi:hypothetical protein